MKTRREFIKCAAGGACALVVGSKIPWFLKNEAHAATTTLNFTITDAVKEMVTHNAINTAECYFWIYKEATLPPEVPGPHLFVTKGDTVEITLTNQLDEPHSLFIPGMFNSGPILPGATVTRTFIANKAGTHMYYDNLNEPVNRVMGLHGALIVMPPAKAPGALKAAFPHDAPSKNVKKLFNHLGSQAWWPGLRWEQGDPVTDTPPFRQYIWLLHQPSPNLFSAVGTLAPGTGVRRPKQFMNAFLRDPFSPTRNNRIPQYFTINGQSGHFSHNNPYINPNNRVGEPAVIRILNAGLWTHSLHIHANHVYVISINGVSNENPWWMDVFTANPMDIIEWVVPYMRPPDVPNVRGIGRADTPLESPGILGNPHPCWPPIEELNTVLPAGLTAGNGEDLSVQLSPLCYPMHDHSEPTQTAQGGNYNLGLIAGLNFTGDRNTAGGVTNFPNQPLIHSPGPLGVFTTILPPPWFL